MANNLSGDKLSRKLEKLIKKQYELDKEINKLKGEVNYLLYTKKTSEQASIEPIGKDNSVSENISIPETDINIIEKKKKTPDSQTENQPIPDSQTLKMETVNTQPAFAYNKKKASNLERFIGENLINKIGIAILVIGVAIGSKYAIENFDFGVTFRIVAGYILGASLLGLAIWLKSKYLGFSAVLLSGAMAIFYFISYTAYSFHDLIPRNLSFILLLLFTLFTVFAALNYNQQIIAHFGLVGAYITPFLVSSGSSAWNILMIYVFVINTGILIIAIKKYWRSLHISSFVATYLILASWYAFDYEKYDFKILFGYLTIFFVLFYSTFLINKLINKGKFGAFDIILLSANSFFYYGFGMGLINQLETETNYFGIFTLFNALLHFSTAFIIFRQKQAEKSMFLFIAGLVLLFLTLVFPSQFDGNWVTIFWAGEALILFLVGRVYRIKAYEISSYPLVVLSFFSLIHDWLFLNDKLQLNGLESVTPFLNICFFTALFLSAVYLIILKFESLTKYKYPEIDILKLRKVFITALPLLIITTLYLTFIIELDHSWDFKYQLSEKQIYLTSSEDSATTIFNRNILRLEKIWTVNFSILFFSILSYLLLGLKAAKHYLLSMVIVLAFHIVLFLFLSLYQLSELRESYLEPAYPDHYSYSNFLNMVRYLCFIFVGMLLLTMRNIFNQIKPGVSRLFDIILAVTVIWILSSELLQWLDIANAEKSYKLVLSILWGILALLLVIWGILKVKTHIRISAFVLIGIILIKMFFYDLSHMNGFKRSILFIALGILMLGISFLYNKYKHRIIENTDK